MTKKLDITEEEALKSGVFPDELMAGFLEKMIKEFPENEELTTKFKNILNTIEKP